VAVLVLYYFLSGKGLGKAAATGAGRLKSFFSLTTRSSPFKRKVNAATQHNLAFIVAYTRMYGDPLTMYSFTWAFATTTSTHRNPTLRVLGPELFYAVFTFFYIP
jgi:hypothetical protein